jgi:hypothetical protein
VRELRELGDQVFKDSLFHLVKLIEGGVQYREVGKMGKNIIQLLWFYLIKLVVGDV